ncbi:hypothetical protein BKA69DRAFT_364509 [Paraphysoderma sedebokerense]|nr:hypothetical protein BKA69DRAFT_364509 [Paraphysoderma sedebokerense]
MASTVSVLFLALSALAATSLAQYVDPATNYPAPTQTPAPPAPINFSLMHRTSGKCIHPYRGGDVPADNTNAVLFDGCGLSRLVFQYDASTKSIKHTASGKCLIAQDDSQKDGTALVYSSVCNTENGMFEITPQRGIVHVKSGKCIHPKGGKTNPKKNTPLILYSGCGEDRLLFDKVIVN